MARKEVDIDRQNGKPHVLQVRIKPGHHEVRWSTQDKTDFRIWFPDEWNPLDPGDSKSRNGELIRQISKVQKGYNSHYPYSIFLIDSKEMVESNSPPEMVIE